SSKPERRPVAARTHTSRAMPPATNATESQNRPQAITEGVRQLLGDGSGSGPVRSVDTAGALTAFASLRGSGRAAVAAAAGTSLSAPRRRLLYSGRTIIRARSVASSNGAMGWLEWTRTPKLITTAKYKPAMPRVSAP